MTTMPTFTCKLPPELDARLTAESRARRTTKSMVVREMLERQLTRRPAKRQLRAYDLVKHLVGRLAGPRDLSHHRRHMDGFGE
jgi:predicted transcriptional regulator